MQTTLKRIAINFGGGYVPGLNAVITVASSGCSRQRPLLCL
jgi:6-phosphofructokinase